ncbi:MAG: hypothetical protein DMG07_29270 [Acidobacteria bacterium]|nr:MAG: hypothetical protein DMG07_29270 [Acidobacteriota bacterium]
MRGGILFAGKDTPRPVYDADNNNFAPRIGLAYQVGGNTVVRAGYGIFYIPYNQRFYAAAGSVPGFDTNTFSFSSLNGGLTFPNTVQDLFPTGLAQPIGSSLGLQTFLGQAFFLPQMPRAKPNAYSQRWQVGVQHVFAGSIKLEVRYVGNRTLKMPIAKNINALPNRFLSTSPERDQATINRLSRLVPNPFFGMAGVGGSLGTATVVSASSLLLPFPAFSSITTQLNQGRSWYDALQVELERRLSKGLTFQTMGYLNPADDTPERVIGYQTRPHMWRFMGIYELPFGRGKRFGSNVGTALEWLVGGWQMQGITYVQSGTPIPFQNSVFRGNIKEISIDDPTRERLFNISGFERDPAKQLASNVRTFPSRFAGVRYPHFSTTDFSLIKSFKVERFSFEVRAEAYNVFNNHFFNDNAGYGYGVPSAADTNPLSQNFGATQVASIGRVLQGVLRLVF